MTTAEAPDYSDYADEQDDDKLAQLSRMALLQQEAEVRVAEVEEKLAIEKATLSGLQDSAIPDLMAALNLEQIKTACGLTVSVKKQLRVSVPKDRREDAYDWLDENGASQLVKRSFVISFTKNEEKWAAKFERDCKQRKKPLAIERGKAVASASLKKFLTDALAEGILDVPLELFGAYHQRQSKIKA